MCSHLLNLFVVCLLPCLLRVLRHVRHFPPPAVGVMLLWDHLSRSTHSVGDTASGMLTCWSVPEQQRTPIQRDQCTEILVGELVSVAAFGPMLLLSNLLLLFVFVAPLKWIMLGKMTTSKLQSSSAVRQWVIHTFVMLQRSMHVRFATMMIQGTELFNVFLRMVGYKVRRAHPLKLCWVGFPGGGGTGLHIASQRDRHCQFRVGGPQPPRPQRSLCACQLRGGGARMAVIQRTRVRSSKAWTSQCNSHLAL